MFEHFYTISVVIILLINPMEQNSKSCIKRPLKYRQSKDINDKL